MSLSKKSIVLAAGLLSGALMGGDAMAQCSGRGGGGGRPTGSPTTLASSYGYPQNPLASGGYSQANLMAMQYQQCVLATRQQVANIMYQNAQQESLSMMQREAQARPYRLARAEAKRAARAERIAVRLREQGRYSDSYTLASVNVD